MPATAVSQPIIERESVARKILLGIGITLTVLLLSAMGRIIYTQFYYSPSKIAKTPYQAAAVLKQENLYKSVSNSQCGYVFEYPIDWQRSTTGQTVVLTSYKDMDRRANKDELKIIVNCKTVSEESQSGMINRLRDRYGEDLPAVERVEMANNPAWKQKIPNQNGDLLEYYVFNRKGEVVVITVSPMETSKQKELVGFLSSLRF